MVIRFKFCHFLDFDLWFFSMEICCEDRVRNWFFSKNIVSPGRKIFANFPETSNSMPCAGVRLVVSDPGRTASPDLLASDTQYSSLPDAMASDTQSSSSSDAMEFQTSPYIEGLADTAVQHLNGNSSGNAYANNSGTDVDGSIEYEVEAIVGHGFNSDGDEMVKVQWKGWKKQTWQPIGDMTHCPEILEVFKRNNE